MNKRKPVQVIQANTKVFVLDEISPFFVPNVMLSQKFTKYCKAGPL